MILAIDPGNEKSAYVWIQEKTLVPDCFDIIPNTELIDLLYFCEKKDTLAIEKIKSYGMPVGDTVFDTCIWTGRFVESWDRLSSKEYFYITREDVKLNLCNTKRAKDSNVIQALIDRFAPNTPNRGKGYKKEPGWFYGFKADIWQAYAVGVTYHDLYLKSK